MRGQVDGRRRRQDHLVLRATSYPCRRPGTLFRMRVERGFRPRRPFYAHGAGLEIRPAKGDSGRRCNGPRTDHSVRLSPVVAFVRFILGFDPRRGHSCVPTADPTRHRVEARSRRRSCAPAGLVLDGAEPGASLDHRDRPFAALATTSGFRRASSGTRPVSSHCQSATSSFRASATMPIRR